MPTRTGSIVIIGAGPTGLGAAHRLKEIGVDDFVVLEAGEYVGGLARSHTDDAGFTYDIGGHVMFSHYDYYDAVVDAAMGGEHTELRRDAWVWMEGRFIRYPFQNNIGGLSTPTIIECLMGLIEAQRSPPMTPTNFAEFMESTFGAGITKHFMRPYNFKVWATPAEMMSHQWIGERVSVVDVETVLRDVLAGERDVSWGPNSTFRYPLRGGTGSLYDAIAAPLRDHIQLCSPVVAVDPDERVVVTADGRDHHYDALLSTMPLTHLVSRLTSAPDAVRSARGELHWSGSHIVGIGLDRPAGSEKNWIYFPEPDVPFYRVTYLSNYSPHITPRADQTLLLTETSWSGHKPCDESTITAEVIDGLVRCGLMDASDRRRVVTTWQCSPSMTYPVPTVGRDAALGTIQPWLRDKRIWSRGRFGAWLYEIGNMDHSFMQGVEWVDHVTYDAAEVTWIPRGEGPRGEGIR